MPSVSIVVPCFNEERSIRQLLTAILQQDFPLSGLEVIIADGHSTDSTRAKIDQFQKAHPELYVRVIDNPARTIPAALNLAIATAQGQTIVRLDAHSAPARDYVSRSLSALDAGLGWNVGGVWEIQPGALGWLAYSIAAAASHPLGVGDAFYRFTRRAQQVDTVPFGAFRKTLISKIGPFDESLLSNEDYEFNTRVRNAGGSVWLDPSIRSAYIARATLVELVRQYARYGYWKAKMLRRYPNSLRARQAIPPLFVLSLITLPLLGIAWPWLYSLLILEVVSYAALLLGAALLKALEQKRISLLLGLPLSMATMHLSWGVAFLWSLVSSSKRQA